MCFFGRQAEAEADFELNISHTIETSEIQASHTTEGSKEAKARTMETKITEDTKEQNPGRVWPALQAPSRPSAGSGRLPLFIDFWRKVTSNNFVLKIVEFGYKLQFYRIPPFMNLSSGHFSTSRTISLSKEVSTLISKSAIFTVPPSKDQFVSPIFDIPKKDSNNRRIILNLKTLNKFIIKVGFKLEGYEEIMDMIRPGDYFVSIDLQDAYLMFSMHPFYWKFLCFQFLDTRYCYKVMPFGLTSAPRIFTKVFKRVLVFLRGRGLRVTAWFDDIILMAESVNLLLEHLHFTKLVIKSLGFIPHPVKSMLIPSQSIYHLGFNWDSVKFIISVPEEKVKDLKELCKKTKSGPVKLRFLNKILGTIENFRIGFTYAALYYRGIQKDVASYISLNYDWDHCINLSDPAVKDIDWWLSCPLCLMPKSLEPFLPNVILYTDSSETGWGGVTSDDIEAYGFWSEEESLLHINILETKTVLLTLKSLFRNINNTSVLIRSDSTTTVSYLNNLGGVKNTIISNLIKEIYDFCILKSLRIQASHLSGRLNSRADSLSRRSRDHCYSIPLKIFKQICKIFSISPLVDLFASRLNNKLPNYFSEGPDPYASDFDAFMIPWPHSIYAFPPIHLVQKVISRFLELNIEFGILISPFWPSQPYFSSLLSILIDNPLIISASVVENASVLPLNVSSLMASCISSNPVLQREFRQKQPLASSEVLKQQPYVPTSDAGGALLIGVSENRYIRAHYL